MPPKGTKRKRSVDDDASSISSSSSASPAAKVAKRSTPSVKTPKSPLMPLEGIVDKVVREPKWHAQMKEKKSQDSIWSDVVPFVRRTTDAEYKEKEMMKMISWNVAGLRGLLKKNGNALADLVKKEQPLLLCLQETKLNVDEEEANAQVGMLDGYVCVDHPCAVRRGYSGTRTYIHIETCTRLGLEVVSSKGLFVPPHANNDNNNDEMLRRRTLHASPLMEVVEPVKPCATGLLDVEGRIISTILRPSKTSSNNNTGKGSLALLNTYIPNSGMTLNRLDFRCNTYDRRVQKHIDALHAHCGASSDWIWAGDLNVAARDFDRYYAKDFASMQLISGFTPEERHSFRQTLSGCGGVDALDALYPRSGPVSTYWSHRLGGRERGLGWRLDYFVLSTSLAPRLVDCFAMPEVLGSDHCPVQAWLRIDP